MPKKNAKKKKKIANLQHQRHPRDMRRVERGIFENNLILYSNFQNLLTW